MRNGSKSIGHSYVPTGLKNLFQSTFNGLKKFPKTPFSLTDNNNLRLCCGVIRGTATNNANDAITWVFITTGGHSFVLFDSAITTNGNGEAVLTHPSGKVVSYITTPDEAYAAMAIFVGSDIVDSLSDSIGMFTEVGNHAGTLIGNGTNWTLSNMGSFDVIVNSLSEIQFNPPKPYGGGGTNGQNLNYWTAATARYTGLTAGVSIKRTLFYRGFYDASGNVYPSTLGSGTSGAIMKGDVFYLSVAGTLNGSIRAIGASVTALVDSPGQTDGNWQIDNTGGPIFGYQLITNTTGLPVSVNSTDDIIEIDTTTPDFIRLSMSANDTNGFPGVGVHSVNSNIWVIAVIDISK